MDTKWSVVISGAVIVSIMLVVMFGSSLLGMFSIYSYSKSVPISIGYQEAEENFVLSTIVSETERFRLVLDVGTIKEVDDDITIETTEEVGLLFEPKHPESQTNLLVMNYVYIQRWGVFGVGKIETKVPVLDIADANWLTSAFYDVSVYKGGSELVKETVEVNYLTQHVIYLETDEGTVTLTNMGLAMDGVEQPSGDLVTAEVPNGGRQIWNKADLLFMLDKWNEYMQWEQLDLTKVFTWSDVWGWAVSNGYLPPEVQMIHVENIDYIEDLDYLRLRYAGLCFKANVVCYIPSSMAESIIVNLMAPQPQIVSISPDPLPEVPEGQSCVFYVNCKNIGTEGTVDISVLSDYYSFTPLTPTSRQMDADETYSFKFSAYALNVFSSKSTTVDILVQGRGGTDTYELIGSISDVEGYTPPGVDPNPDPNPNDDFPWIWIIILIIIFVVVVIAIYLKLKFERMMDVFDR